MITSRKLVIALVLTSFAAGAAMAAARKQAVPDPTGAPSGWGYSQSYDDPAPGDQPKGSIH